MTLSNLITKWELMGVIIEHRTIHKLMLDEYRHKYKSYNLMHIKKDDYFAYIQYLEISDDIKNTISHKLLNADITLSSILDTNMIPIKLNAKITDLDEYF